MAIVLAFSAHKVYKRKKAWTPTHEKVYQYHMINISMPDGKEITVIDLQKLADQCEALGYGEKASMLRKRAKLRELPDDIKEQRHKVFMNVVACTDPDKIEPMIQVYEQEGCMGTVATLKEYVKGLRAVDPTVRMKVADFLQQKSPESEAAKTMAFNLRSKGNEEKA